MVRKSCITVLVLFACISIYAQQYTQPRYAVRKDSAIIFGDEQPLNYCGRPFALKMNMYKPVGDGNTQRPVVICVHGGAFTSGVDFNESTMNVMAMEFAKRGYVAVSINYREGHHLFPYTTGNPQFKDAGSMLAFNIVNGGTDWTVQARLYVADSIEVIRSLYRAQQDVKAAIRKMKQRRLTDSTSVCRVFLAGHSAGAISVLTAALTDVETEKPAAAGAIANAANPDWKNRCEWPNPFNPSDCWLWQAEGPAGRDNQAYLTNNPAPFNYNAASCYTRPDLGSVNGNTNLGSAQNTKVMGVASFCGAILDTAIFGGNAYPPIFMYHQPGDLVVDYNTNRPFNYLGNFLTPAPNSKWPVFYGSNWIKNKMNRMGYPGANVLWTYDNSANDPLGTMAHGLVPSIAFVTDSAAKFFSKVMDTSTLCVSTVLPLPIAFTAENVNARAMLRWTMNSTGASTEKFLVQFSADGRSFYDIGARPFIQNTRDYSFVHQSPVNGANYYRIAVVDRSGIMEYSEVQPLYFGNKAETVKVYPMPVTDRLNIELPGGVAQSTAQLNIMNTTGKKVITKNYQNQQLIQVDCSALPAGIYFMEIVSGGTLLAVEKIVKTN